MFILPIAGLRNQFAFAVPHKREEVEPNPGPLVH